MKIPKHVRFFGGPIHFQSLSNTTTSDLFGEDEACIQASLASISSIEQPNIAVLALDYAVSKSRPQAYYKRTDQIVKLASLL